MNYHYVQDSAGNSVLVKGDINAWIEEKGLGWKDTKNGKCLYAGKRKCSITPITDETIAAMSYIFDKEY